MRNKHLKERMPELLSSVTLADDKIFAYVQYLLDYEGLEMGKAVFIKDMMDKVKKASSV